MLIRRRDGLQDAQPIERIGECLKLLGLEVWETGGGCQAYGIQHPDGRQLLITESSGGVLPDPGESTIAGAYDADRGEEIGYAEFSAERYADLYQHVIDFMASKDLRDLIACDLAETG